MYDGLFEENYASDMLMGDQGPEVEMWQTVIGTFPDGVWKLKDELAYEEYTLRSQWRILKKTCPFPKFWEVL